MSSAKNKYFFEIKVLLVAFMLACGLWYVIVGNAHIESIIAVRVEYQSVPADLVVSEGMIDVVKVRVRASAELLQRLANRDLAYPIDLSKIESGANVVPIEIAQMVSFNGFDILGVDPSYIVVEVDTVTTKTVPLQIKFIPMKDDDLQISNVGISPAAIEIKGSTALLHDLDYLEVPFDLNKVIKEGHYSRPLQLMIPDSLTVNTPVTTLSFDVVAETTHVEISRTVHVENMPPQYTIEPRTVNILLEAPLARVHDDVLDPIISSKIRATVTGNSHLKVGSTLPIQVILPWNVQLVEMDPAAVKIVNAKK